MTNFPKDKLKKNKPVDRTTDEENERLKSENTFLRQELERLAKEFTKVLNALNPFK